MDLFSQPALPDFDGATYSRPLDHARLSTAMGRIFLALKEGKEMTLAELAAVGKCSEAAASSRCRDFRKRQWQEVYGKWNVISRRVEAGLWKYKMVPA